MLLNVSDVQIEQIDGELNNAVTDMLLRYNEEISIQETETEIMLVGVESKVTSLLNSVIPAVTHRVRAPRYFDSDNFASEASVCAKEINELVFNGLTSPLHIEVTLEPNAPTDFCLEECSLGELLDSDTLQVKAKEHADKISSSIFHAIKFDGEISHLG